MAGGTASPRTEVRHGPWRGSRYYLTLVSASAWGCVPSVVGKIRSKPGSTRPTTTSIIQVAPKFLTSRGGAPERVEVSSL